MQPDDNLCCTGSADTKSKSRLSATMPNHLFKAKDLKKVNKSKMKNNIVLTTEEEEALGYLEEAEQFYKYDPKTILFSRMR